MSFLPELHYVCNTRLLYEHHEAQNHLQIHELDSEIASMKSSL